MEIDIKKNLEKEDEEENKTDPNSVQDIKTQISAPKSLRWWKGVSRWSLLALSALTPLLFLPFTQFPISANKELFVFGAILVVFFAFLGRVLTEGKIRYPSHWLLTALGVLALVWFLSSLFSINLIGSFFGAWSSYESFSAVILFSILALLIAATFDRRDIILATLLFLGALAILGIFEILQLTQNFILPWNFAKSIAFNPVGSVNELGVLLAFGLILSVGLFSSAELPRFFRRALLVLAALFLIDLVFINFWVIWLGLVLAMIVSISFLSAGLSRDFRQNAIGLQLIFFEKAWLATTVLLVALFLLFFPSPLREKIKPPFEVAPTFQVTWNIAWQNLQSSKFLFGTGPNTFSYNYNLQKPQSINNNPIFWSTSFPQGTSSFLNWLVTVGFLGILAILFLAGVFIWAGIKSAALRQSNRSMMNMMSQASFVATLFMFLVWLFYNTNFTNFMFTFWGIGIFLASALFFSYESGESRGRFKEAGIFTSPQKTFLLSLAIVILMAASVASLYLEVERYIAENYFSYAIEASAKRDNAATISNLAKAVEFWAYDERYYQSLAQAIFFQLNDLLARRDLPPEILRAQFQNITSQAINAAQQAANLNPQNPFNSVLLGSIYENLIVFVAGAGDFAASSYSKAVSLDPQNPAHHTAIARVFVTQADLLTNQSKSLPQGVSAEDVQKQIVDLLNKAVSHLEESLALKNDFAPARFLLVQIYDKQGQLNDAIFRAAELVQFGPTDVGAFFQLGFLYYKANQLNNARAAFERAVGLSPNYSNARYFLGLIYDRQGDPSSAIAQFRQIADLNLDNAEVKEILANLRAGRPALFGIAPPPQQRTEAPISEKIKSPISPIKK